MKMTLLKRLKLRSTKATAASLALLLGVLLPHPAAAEEAESKVMKLYEAAIQKQEHGMDAEAEKLLIQATRLKDANKDEAYSAILEQLAYIALNKGDMLKATALDIEAARYLYNMPELEVHVNIYNDLGVIYRHRNMLDSTIFYYNKALESAQKLKDNGWLANITMNIAVVYHSKGRFHEAEQYGDRAVAYAKKSDDAYMRFATLQVSAATKAKVGKSAEALTLARQAWNKAKGDADCQLRCIPTFTAIFEAKGQADSVFHYISIGNQLAQKAEITAISLKSFIQCRANAYYKNERWSDALKDLLTMSHWEAPATPMNTLYEHIAICYDHLGQDRTAYLYMDSARMWTDTLAAKGMEEKLSEFHIKYQSKEKELQLIQMQEQHARQQTMWITFTLILLMLLIVVWLVLNHRQKLRMIRLREESKLNEAAQYISGMEGERKRLAEELHNGVANDLLGLQLRLETTTDNDQIKADISRIREDVRMVSHGLMPPEFSNLNLDTILRHYCSRSNDEADHEVVYDSTGNNWSQLPKDTAYEVFRIAQEWMGNAIRHAHARHIVICLEQADGQGVLEIADDGCGLSDKEKEASGIGLRIIKDRVSLIHGQWSIDSGKEGTTCRLTFPLL